MIGKITGRTITKPINGDKNRIILQVELMTDEDIKTVELISQAGEDTNPANGCRVNIIDITDSYQIGVGVSDDIAPSCDPGEKEFYSTDSPVTTKKARLKLDKNSIVIINNGSDFAVRYNELETAFNQLKSDFNNHIHAGVTTGSGSTGATTPSTADITTAKCDTVKIPRPTHAHHVKAIRLSK